MIKGPKPSSINTQIVHPLLSPKIFKTGHNRGKNKCSKTKSEGYNNEHKVIICRQFSKRSLSIFGNYRQCQCDGNLDLHRIYKEKHLLSTKSFVVLQ